MAEVTPLDAALQAPWQGSQARDQDAGDRIPGEQALGAYSDLPATRACLSDIPSDLHTSKFNLMVPPGSEPGSLLSVPVRGGERINVQVREGMGPGSTLVVTQNSREACEVSVGGVVPAGCASRVASEVLVESPRVDTPPEWAFAQSATVRLSTTAGELDILVRKDWAPEGAQRFLELVSHGDFDDHAFYRAVPGSLVQFGLPLLRELPPIPDDPHIGVPFLHGAVSFSAGGPNERRAKVFICLGDMSHALGQNAWETPFGAVADESLEVLGRVETRHGEIRELGGTGPDAGQIAAEGNRYLRSSFPGLTWIRSARVVA